MNSQIAHRKPPVSRLANPNTVRLSTVLLKSATVIFTIALVILWWSPAWAADGSISGTVTDIDGKPLPDMIVTLDSQNLDPCCPGWAYVGDVTTDLDGSYLFNGLEAAAYRIGVFDANRFPTRFANEYYDNAFEFESATDITVAPGEDVTEINIEVEELAKIAGTVTDTDGSPLLEIPVTLFSMDDFNNWAETETVYTDANGRYLLTVPYGFSTGNVRIQFGQATSINRLRLNTSRKSTKVLVMWTMERIFLSQPVLRPKLMPNLPDLLRSRVK